MFIARTGQHELGKELNYVGIWSEKRKKAF